MRPEMSRFVPTNSPQAEVISFNIIEEKYSHIRSWNQMIFAFFLQYNPPSD